MPVMYYVLFIRREPLQIALVYMQGDSFADPVGNFTRVPDDTVIVPAQSVAVGARIVGERDRKYRERDRIWDWHTTIPDHFWDKPITAGRFIDSLRRVIETADTYPLGGLAGAGPRHDTHVPSNVFEQPASGLFFRLRPFRGRANERYAFFPIHLDPIRGIVWVVDVYALRNPKEPIDSASVDQLRTQGRDLPRLTTDWMIEFIEYIYGDTSDHNVQLFMEVRAWILRMLNDIKLLQRAHGDQRVVAIVTGNPDAYRHEVERARTARRNGLLAWGAGLVLAAALLKRNDGA